jgi:DnaJ family protein A protein 2
MSDLYARLGVGRNATTEEIRRAYKDLAKQKHPDRGGNAEEFKAIQEAHEVLCDDERRKIYDMTGSTNEQQGGGPPGGMAAGGFPFHFMSGAGPFGMPGMHVDIGDVFSRMFGGGAATGPTRRRDHRGPNKHHDIDLRLSDFFKGKTIDLKFNQARRCTTCKGSGAEASEPCGPCSGRGIRTQMRQIGPGMIAQTQAPCDVCNGEGTRILRPCRGCHGKRFIEKEKKLEIKINPGMRDGEQLVFPGECSDTLEYDVPGDAVLTLRLIASVNDRYEWREDDLWIQHTVSYAESILGFTFKLEDHPNGFGPEFKWRGGPLIHGAVLQMPGLGMPKKAGGFGNLYIQVMITPPVTKPWSSEDAIKLQSVLGAPSTIIDEGLTLPLTVFSSESKLRKD